MPARLPDVTLTCYCNQQLRQTIKLHEKTFDYDLRTKDGQIISHQNWSEKISQEKSLHIDLFVPSENSETGSETESDPEYVVIEPDRIMSESPTPSEPAEIVTIEPEQHTQSQDIDEIFEALATQKLAEGRDKVDDLEIPTIKPTGHHTPLLSEQPESLRGRKHPFASDNISPIRRAETIGLAPSRREHLGLGFDRSEPRPVKRYATIDFDLRPTHIEPFQVEPKAQIPPPQRKRPHSGSPVRVDGFRQAEAPRLGELYERHEMRSSSRTRQKNSINQPMHATSPSAQYSDHVLNLPPSTHASGPASFPPASSPLSTSMTPGLPTGPHKTKTEDESNLRHKQRRSQTGSGNHLKPSGKRVSSSTGNLPSRIFRLVRDERPRIKENQTNTNAVSEDAAFALGQSENAILHEKDERHSQSRNGPDPPSIHDSEDYQADYAMAKMLDDTDKQLTQSEKSKETKYYNRIEKKSLKDVEGAMEKLVKAHIQEPSVTLGVSHANAKKVLARKYEIIEIAKKLLGAFVPEDYPCPIVEKFWGSVYLLLGDTVRSSIPQNSPSFSSSRAELTSTRIVSESTSYVSHQSDML